MKKRVASLDLLRGIVMIIMALDHVRDYFHGAAWLYSPTDMRQTSVVLFLTRWVTHFCAPVFVFLAGISACLYGAKKGRKALARFLWTRGIWLVVVDLFVVGFFRTFDFSFFNLQVLWAIGGGMIVLSALLSLDRNVLLLIGVVLVGTHNLFDTVHVAGSGPGAIIWSLLHDPKSFSFGHTLLMVRYPVLPWMGILLIGYYTGYYYLPEFDPETRPPKLILMGYGAIGLFIVLRAINGYGDASHWASQDNAVFTFLSFLNVTKYPPSLLYILMTLGPALIFLALAERQGGWEVSWPVRGVAGWSMKKQEAGRLKRWEERIAIFGRTAMFYYLAHILLIHLLAVVAVLFTGYHFSDMVLSGPVNDQQALKGYGFPLIVVYLVWIGAQLLLYPLCRWYDRYKRAHQATKWWLSYL